MKFQLDFINQANAPVVGYRKLFYSLALTLFKVLNLPSSFEVTVMIVNDRDIQTYNSTYRNKDKPTDVLSFPLQNYNSHQTVIHYEPTQLKPLGDIIISFETAKRQARQYHHRLRRELAFLFLHGLLHLLGYDHDTPTGEKEMFSMQEKILNQFQIYRQGGPKNE